MAKTFLKTGVRALGALALIGALAGCTTVKPFDVTGNPVGSKVGESSGTITVFDQMLWSIKPTTVDYGLQTAAKNGGITKIATVDVKVKDSLFAKTFTTVVTGE